MNPVKLALIGGTGLGELLSSSHQGHHHHIETPFGRPSSPIVETQWEGLPLFILQRHGPGHLLNPSAVPYRANIFALKQLGVTHIIASGACGSLREEFKPRDLVIPDQIIDKTHKRAGTFFDDVAVHVEFAEPFCPVLRQILMQAATDSPFAVHKLGCYVAMEGPAFSTRSESVMHRLWGCDLVGMTAMPEAKSAREAQISYALVAMVTDYDCWKPKAEGDTVSKEQLLAEILGNLKSATDNALILIRKALSMIAQQAADLPVSPAHSSLELAIWSDRRQIPPEVVQRLAPLWIKYMDNAG